MLSQSAGFRFDRTLWRRFITVFQLYLYPKSPRSARHLFWLLFSGFLGVLLISMLLFSLIKVSCATFSLSFYNHYIKSVLRGFFVFDFNPTLNKLIVVSSILFVIGLYFYSQKTLQRGVGNDGLPSLQFYFFCCVLLKQILFQSIHSGSSLIHQSVFRRSPISKLMALLSLFRTLHLK